VLEADITNLMCRMSWILGPKTPGTLWATPGMLRDPFFMYI